MKGLQCDCGQRVFFESTACVHCGRRLGFDPQRLELLSLAPVAGLLADPDDQRYAPCRNQVEHGNCNWLLPAAEAGSYCRACRLNRVIPNLSRPGNIGLWSRLEQAKRRLLYTLIRLGLPFDDPAQPPLLTFRFLEDRRRNPEVEEEIVVTGHTDGVITINVAEADDASRHAVREQMQERYRTLLGHFRHEAGHYYLDRLVTTPAEQAEFRSLYGDERQDYAAALAVYYQQGPPADWPARWVSAYASAHPLEDWAESFAHFLHIVDALETAHSFGLTRALVGGGPTDDWAGEWSELSVALNELNRSLGQDDPYPFVLAPAALARLDFIHRQVARGVRPQAAGAGPRRPS